MQKKLEIKLKKKIKNNLNPYITEKLDKLRTIIILPKLIRTAEQIVKTHSAIQQIFM